MNSTSGGWINLLIVWGIASAIGFVSMAVLMMVGDWSVMQALFAAAVIFLGLGIVLSVLFLNPLPGPQVPGSAGKNPTMGVTKPGSAAPAPKSAPASASAPVAAPVAAAPSKPAPPAAKPKVAAAPPASATAPAPAAAAGPGKRPAALSAARDNRPDDLKRIKGIGPKLEKLCNSLGFFHFDQIAKWTDEEIAWVDQNLEGFKGRVVRDDWVAQAQALANAG
ncbi:NADH:ubiquinone oxidoreductase [Roseicyclus sp.]|uniref:NADH:ubiquinone oxidoreductase n=1 Tax=Roseicyclus sp. TaxID=1914329 RepID=UPI003F6C052E